MAGVAVVAVVAMVAVVAAVAAMAAVATVAASMHRPLPARPAVLAVPEQYGPGGARTVRYQAFAATAARITDTMPPQLPFVWWS